MAFIFLLVDLYFLLFQQRPCGSCVVFFTDLNLKNNLMSLSLSRSREDLGNRDTVPISKFDKFNYIKITACAWKKAFISNVEILMTNW